MGWHLVVQVPPDFRLRQSLDLALEVKLVALLWAMVWIFEAQFKLWCNKLEPCKTFFTPACLSLWAYPTESRHSASACIWNIGPGCEYLIKRSSLFCQCVNCGPKVYNIGPWREEGFLKNVGSIPPGYLNGKSSTSSKKTFKTSTPNTRAAKNFKVCSAGEGTGDLFIFHYFFTLFFVFTMEQLQLLFLTLSFWFQFQFRTPEISISVWNSRNKIKLKLLKKRSEPKRTNCFENFLLFDFILISLTT
jgi:hypothetical protein